MILGRLTNKRKNLLPKIYINMKSKKETLDKYPQGEFTNYRNEVSPPKTLAEFERDIFEKAAGGYVKADRKAEAIAFAEWILENYAPWGSRWREVDSPSDDSFTTEELYSLFLSK